MTVIEKQPSKEKAGVPTSARNGQPASIPAKASEKLWGKDAPQMAGNGEPFSEQEARRIIEQYNRDGYAVMPGVLSPEEVQALRDRIDAAFESPEAREKKNWCDDIIMTRMFELDPMFVQMLTREPMLSVMNTMLGPDCHIMASNCLRNPRGRAIDQFHADDFLWCPLPDDVPRHDPRITMPNYIVHFNYALTDITALENGPLQVVPGSHYSGRQPNDPKNPTFEGRGPLSVTVKAGDAYMQHPQVWHRGAPNNSDRTRCIYGVGWGRRFISHRFYPFLNYRYPDHVLKDADETLLRVLGKHERAAYG